MTQSNAQFTIDLTPGEPLHAGTGRFDFTKTWTGDLIGTSAGTMLSAGNQPAGIRGTVDLDVVEGVHRVVLHHNV